MSILHSREPDVIDKLRVALTMVESVKNDNDTLQSKLDMVNQPELNKKQQANNEHMLKKYESLIEEFEILSNEKISFEQEFTETVESNKQETQKLNNEIDRLKTDTIQPKDIEAIKLKIQKQVKDSFDEKWKIQELELEKYRIGFYNLKKEYQVLVFEKEATISKHKLDLKEYEQDKNEEISELRAKLIGLQSSLVDTTDLTKLRSFQRENSELSLKVNSLLREISEINSQKEQIKVDYEQKERLNQRRIIEETSHSKSLFAEKEALKTKIENSDNENRKLMIANENSHQELHNCNLEIERTRNKLEEIQHNFAVEVSDLKTALLKERSKHDAILLDLRGKLNEEKSVNKTLNDTIQQLRRKATEHDREFSERMQIIREEDMTKMARLESEKQDLEASLSTYKQIKSHQDKQDDQTHMDLHRDITQLKIDKKQATRQVEELKTQLFQITQEKEKYEIKTSQLVSKLEDLQMKLKQTRQIRENQSKEDQTLIKHSRNLEILLKENREELKRITDQFEKERVSHNHNLERYKNILNRERNHFQQELKVVQDENSVLASSYRQLQNDSKKHSKKSKGGSIEFEHDTSKTQSEKQTEFMELLSKEGLLDV